jgi:hypothetical protein
MKALRAISFIVAIFVKRSEEHFLYESIVMNSLLTRKLSDMTLLDLKEELTEGLSGRYREFFERIRHEKSDFYDKFTCRL